MKQPKRACPKCGGAVQVIRSVTVSKSAFGAEKYQRLRCQVCGLNGSAHQTDEVTWECAGLADFGQAGKIVKHQ